jgi:hypothetical protein
MQAAPLPHAHLGSKSLADECQSTHYVVALSGGLSDMGCQTLRSTRDSAGSLVHSAVKLAAAFNNHNNQATTAPPGPSAPQASQEGAAGGYQGPAYSQQGGGQGGGGQGGDAPPAGTQAMAAPAPPAPPAGGLLSMLPAFLRPKPPPDAGAPATQRGLAEILPAGGAVTARRAPRRLADGVSAGGGAEGSGGTTQNAVLALAGAASNAWNRISGVPGAEGAHPGPGIVCGASCTCAHAHALCRQALHCLRQPASAPRPEAGSPPPHACERGIWGGNMTACEAPEAARRGAQAATAPCAPRSRAWTSRCTAS